MNMTAQRILGLIAAAIAASNDNLQAGDVVLEDQEQQHPGSDRSWMRVLTSDEQTFVVSVTKVG